MQTLMIVAALICCASALAGGAEIRQIEADGAMLIDTSPSNYAVSSPELLKLDNWKTVSVNGNQVTISTATCQNIVKDSQSLSQEERAKLTDIASRLIVADPIGNNQQQQQPSGAGRRSSARFSLGSNGQTGMSRSEGASMSSLQSNGLSVNSYDEHNYSISKPGLPNGLSRIFVSQGDLATFVYADGRVLMKPIACLDATESQLLQQIQLEVQQAKQQMKMNMRQMQDDMQRNMLNMQQNMANMFSNPGFPFNQQQQQGYGFQNGQAQAYAGYPNYNQFQGSYPVNSGPYTPPIAPSSPIAPVAPLQPMQPMQQMQQMQPNTPHNPFGNNFPFGPNNSPFGNNFPFGPNNSPFGNNFPFGPNNSPFGAGFPFGH